MPLSSPTIFCPKTTPGCPAFKMTGQTLHFSKIGCCPTTPQTISHPCPCSSPLSNHQTGGNVSLVCSCYRHQHTVARPLPQRFSLNRLQSLLSHPPAASGRHSRWPLSGDLLLGLILHRVGLAGYWHAINGRRVGLYISYNYNVNQSASI